VPHYKIARRKIFPDRQFTGKNAPRLAAAQAGWILISKLSAGGDFSGGRSWDDLGAFYGTGDILIMGRNINSVILPGRIFHGVDILM